MIKTNYDVAIIGAGIVGAACADECARAGLKVVVIEAAQIGGEATAAGMGHLVVMDDSEAQFALTNYSRSLWAELSAELPPSSEMDFCGTLWVAADDEEMAEVERKRRFYEERKVAVEVLDARSLAEAEPHLRANLAGALRVPRDAVIYPPCAASYLIKRAEKNKASVMHGRRVTALKSGGVVLDDNSVVNADVVVVATGSCAPALVPEIDVQKRKGHLVITDRYQGFLRHQLIELGYLKSAHSLTADSVAFNVQPRRTGQILIGSSRQYGVEDRAVETNILRRMLDRACEYMPDIARLNALRVWTGFRAATPDKLPLIGAHPAAENLYLATGHEGLGITTSLGTAKLLVDQLLDRPSAIAREPYLPSRMLKQHVSERIKRSA